jgi:2-polyprenyl-3-methyl-5-hydroxy-6-metoxy-1,4-benzoquinol methylase
MTNFLIGETVRVDRGEFSSSVAVADSKNRFVMDRCRGKLVLDLGCVQHNPAFYQSKFWLHRAIREVTPYVMGMDLYAEGVAHLRSLGFDIVVGDAQNFDLERKFDVIVAGDLIEHLENFDGFLKCAKSHLSPGGSLLITTPNPWYWRNLVKAMVSTEVANNEEHTCWLCPRTLRQLVRRHGMDLGDIEFGSRYQRDLLMPLPRGWKHTSFYAEVHVS